MASTAGFKKILCPTDFSDASQHALQYAMDFAVKLGASVEVLHVYQLPIYAFPDGAVIPRAELTTEILNAAQEHVERIVEKLKGSGVEVSSKLVEGVPHSEIEREAAAVGADLVVMGTHGRTGLSHMLLGSVAERVLRTSKVPVLTVRHPESKKG